MGAVEGTCVCVRARAFVRVCFGVRAAERCKREERMLGGDDCVPRGHWAMPGDVLSCQNRGSMASAMHRMVPPGDESFSLNS